MQATTVRTIQPYLDFGTWVFDDPATGLHVLVAAEPHVGGIIYKHEKSGLSGWLCPALFLYFNRAPEHIYARFYNVHVSGGPKP